MIRPPSNRSSMGTANSVCEMISGGVINMPITKAPTTIYGRFSARRVGVVAPAAINKKVATGISNASPKAKKIAIIKSRY